MLWLPVPTFQLLLGTTFFFFEKELDEMELKGKETLIKEKLTWNTQQ